MPIERKRRLSCKQKQRFSWVACQASKHPVALAAATLAALGIYVYASGETKKEKRDHYEQLINKYESRTGVLLQLLKIPGVLDAFSKRELTQTFLTYMMVRALVLETNVPMFDAAFANLTSFVSPQDIKDGILLQLNNRVNRTLELLSTKVLTILQHFEDDSQNDSSDVTRAVHALKNRVILAVLYKSREEISDINNYVEDILREHFQKPLDAKTTLIDQYLRHQQTSDGDFGVIPMPDIVAKNLRL